MSAAQLSGFAPARLQFVQHSIDIAHHFEVPESQYGVTASAQELAPAFVLLFLICVLRTINFDDQPGSQANEVDEERTDRVLRAKLELAYLLLGQSGP